MMKQNLFISYSRRQTPFVDRLADVLEDNGYFLWLDYQSLVPARPWLDQIKAGLDQMDVLLLVVSKESLKSPHVRPEWEGALERKKRIILLIFEAVPLPPELQRCEWVDFRSKYSRRIKQLMNILENKVTVKDPVPQKGFRAPVQFWFALILSVIVAVGSLPTWWALFIPYILVPLPWQIYKRNYIFSRVIPTLLLLPFLFVATWIFFIEQGTGNVITALEDFSYLWFFPASVSSWILAVLLMTPAMQRRAMPEAARARFANPKRVDGARPRSIPFLVDHALEDSQYAHDLRRGLERNGHRLAAADETPEAIFVLISSYKKNSTFDPDLQPVFPIILQAVDDIDPALQRIQWINFRKGIHNVKKLAQLLPEPERLLKVLAVAPTGRQEDFPFGVSALQFFYLITGILAGGGLLTAILSLTGLIRSGDLDPENWFRMIGIALIGALLFAIVAFSVKSLRTRSGGASTFYPLMILTLYQATIQLSMFAFLFFLVPAESDQSMLDKVVSAGSGILVSLFSFPVGLAILALILPFRWRDLNRWFPRRQESMVSRLESMFMLYTPTRRRALFLHIIFHVFLVFIYISLVLMIATSFTWWAWLVIMAFILTAVGIRRWARHISI